MKAAKSKKPGWWSRFRRARRVLRALTKADPVGAAQVDPPEKLAQVHRVVTAAEVIKRVGEIKIYENDGDRLLEFNPRGWHREESFAFNKNKPTPVAQFADVGGMTAQREKELQREKETK